ncbi:carbohydrate ABC transporter permease [Kallotenue papyrolyticum]|uniref:carbohydrate ABC transporter permease n=1 Tax=Kallotenue papyrolyticum TaxID=1325125 RepID=UPI0004729D61|nr:sugar ABC transporter permease [Kallotenue papyrolyticum]
MSHAALERRSTPARPFGARFRRFVRQHAWSYAFVLPSMLTFTVFVLIPVCWSLIISFQDYRLTSGGTWVGLENYRVAFTTQSGVFVRAIRNTIYYTLVTVTANILIALALASMIQGLSKWAQNFFRAAFYLPAVTSVVIIAITWRWLLSSQPNGFFNYLRGLLGLAPLRWLADPTIALESIMLSTILTVPATGVVLYTAAMGSIPKEFYEAAEIDGAGPIQRWWYITVPLIKPTTLYLLVLYTIASFEVFEKILLMTPSGVGNATQTIVFQIYQNGFVQFRYGVAAAQAFILFLMIASVAVVQFRVLRSDVEY